MTDLHAVLLVAVVALALAGVAITASLRSASKGKLASSELVLKDVSTVSYHPEHLERWEKIAREFIPDC